MSDNNYGINLINLGEMKKIKWNNLAFLTLCMLTIIACSSYAYEDDDNFVYVNPYTTNNAEYIAVFGDIQYYTNKSSIRIFKNSLNWIEKAKEEINIVDVLHTGDITNSNNRDQEEWKYFTEAMSDFSLPFISNIGNHDYAWDRAGKIVDRNDTYFNKYTRFPLVTTNIEAAFEAGRMENIVIRNEIHGCRYDLLLLEFGPRKEVVEWAKEWVASHPDIKFIMMTHEYLEKGGGRRAGNKLTCVAQFNNTNTTYTTPEELWNQFIKSSDNIVCVLCGHVGGLYAVTYEENDYGREVCQIQHNIQGSEYRYDNWLMMWEFPVDSDDANVSIINTKTGQLYNSSKSLFKFKYRY